MKSERDDLARSLRIKTRRRGRSPAKAGKRVVDAADEGNVDSTGESVDRSLKRKQKEARKQQKEKKKRKEKDEEQKKERKAERKKEKQKQKSKRRKGKAGAEEEKALEHVAVSDARALDEGESLQEDEILQFMLQQQRNR